MNRESHRFICGECQDNMKRGNYVINPNLKETRQEKEKRVKRFNLALYIVLFAAISPFIFSSTALASSVDPLSGMFTNVRSIIVSAISGIGVLVVLWGIFEWGMAFQTQEGTVQAQAFKRMAGGLIMVVASQILDIIVPQ